MNTQFNYLRPVMLLLTIGFFSCSKSNSNNNPGNGSTGPGSSKVVVDTYAGKAVTGSLRAPAGICADNEGNIYVSETNNNTIRKINLTGSVSLFAGQDKNPGCADNFGPGPSLTFPSGLWADNNGLVYIADYGCGHIKVATNTGIIKTYLVDNPNNYSMSPIGVCADQAANVFMVNQMGSEGVVEITNTGKLVRIGNGATGFTDGPAASAQFNIMSSICINGSGDVYVADSHRIRKISAGNVSTIAGSDKNGFTDGQGASAHFGGAMGLCTDTKGNIYVADIYNNSIRMVTPGGLVTTIAGNGTAGYKDGTGDQAQFSAPYSVCFDLHGILYVADYGNNLVRKVILPQ